MARDVITRERGDEPGAASGSPARPACAEAGLRPGAAARSRSSPTRLCYTGSALAVAALAMLFAGFTSALVVRKGVSSDWRPLALPPVLYLNVAMLLAGSVTFEWARRAPRRDARGALREAAGKSRFAWPIGFGLAFLAGQVVAWRDVAAGHAVPAMNPSAAFFYLLTGVHAVLVIGALLTAVYVALTSGPGSGGARGRARAGAAAIYWHFVAALSIYVLALLVLEM